MIKPPDPVIVVDVIHEAVSKMIVSSIPHINFDAGLNIQIVQGLVQLDNTRTLRDKKYPLIALNMPISQEVGSGIIHARIKRILFATLTSPTDGVLKRYEASGTFKTVLYPMVLEFFKQLAIHQNTTQGDPQSFKYTQVDRPAIQPVGEGLSDFVDAIEILNLDLFLNQIKFCR